MTVNLETLIKAQADAQTCRIEPACRPDFTGYRLAIVTREVTTRFARAYRRSFYEGEIVIAIPTTIKTVTVWSMANRCQVLLPLTDVVWITDNKLARLGAEQAALAPIDVRD